jgi:hypothetical protein
MHQQPFSAGKWSEECDATATRMMALSFVIRSFALLCSPLPACQEADETDAEEDKDRGFGNRR